MRTGGRARYETRFLLASQVTKHRDVEDAQKVFKKAKATTSDNPDFIITDGLKAYPQAFLQEFATNKNETPKLVQLESIKKHPNNNLVERLHGTIRERVKVMRGLGNDQSAQRIADGNKLYYNYLRPHQTLEGKTPAEKAGIDLQLKGNKWENLIKKAKQTKKEKS